MCLSGVCMLCCVCSGLLSLEQRAAATPAASAFTPGKVTSGGTSLTKKVKTPAAANDDDDDDNGVEEEHVMVEMTALSEAWSVFESLVRQAPTSQPLVVVATCHAEAESLPDAFTAFFTAGAGARGGPAPLGSLGSSNPQQQKEQQQQQKQPSGVVTVTSPSTLQYEEAVYAACKYASSAVVGAAAATLSARLNHLLPPPPSPVDSNGPATEEQGLDQGTSPADPTNPGPIQRSSRKGASDPLDLAQGLQLYAQITMFIAQLGMRLVEDGRSELATIKLQGRGGLVSFRTVAIKAANGQYAGLDEFLDAAADTARKIMKRTGRRGTHTAP